METLNTEHKGGRIEITRDNGLQVGEVNHDAGAPAPFIARPLFGPLPALGFVSLEAAEYYCLAAWDEAKARQPELR